MIVMSSDTSLINGGIEKYKDGLERLLRKHGRDVTITSVEVYPGCPTGENFVGEIDRVVVTGQVRTKTGSTSDFSDSFILKRIPRPDAINHKFFNCRRMFENEIFGYEVAIRRFEKFAAGKPARKCFADYFGSESDFIALEDLKMKGYQMGNRVRGFNVQECSLVLEKLSFFHALSFAVKTTQEEVFRDVAGNLRETVFCKELAEGVVGVYWENAVKLAVKSLKNRKDPLLGNAIRTLNSYLDSVLLGMIGVIKPEEPFGVICHGDLWTNNLLMRYNDGVAVDVKMIDLQTMRHGSCVLDVMHLLFTSLDTDLLKLNFDKIISFYYDCLIGHGKAFHEDAIRFTLDELRREFRERIRYGICVACLMFTFVTKEATPEAEELVLSKEELAGEDELDRTFRSLNGLYHDRLYNLIRALVELDLL